MVTTNSLSKEKGFTLIEILIAMSILALLLTIALPQYFGSIARSKDVALQENLRVMRVVIDKYYGDKGRHPTSLEDLVQEKYLRSIPMDPVTESAKTWILVPHQDSESPGISDVKSGATGMSKDGVPYASM